MHKIRWTGDTLTWLTGCTEASAGCANCYAIGQSARNAAIIDAFMAMVYLCPQHTFQVLTKRAERMRDYFARFDLRRVVNQVEALGFEYFPRGVSWRLPPQNLWLGVSIENRSVIDRARVLSEIDISTRFISAEPLLEDIADELWPYLPEIHWLIAGGESGHRARPCHLDWIRNLILRCRETDTIPFVKQMGANFYGERGDRVIREYKRWLWNEIVERDGARRLLEPLIFKQRQLRRRTDIIQIGENAGSLRLGCDCAQKPCHCDALIQACQWYAAGFSTLRAFTIRRPWAWAIAHADKDVENRSWQCPLPPGTPVAIHAGKKWEPEDAEWIEREMGIPVPPESEHPTGVVAIATIGKCTSFTQAVSQWANGSEFCWHLRNVRPLPEPVSQRGEQGIFRLSKDVSATVFDCLLESGETCQKGTV